MTKLKKIDINHHLYEQKENLSDKEWIKILELKFLEQEEKLESFSDKDTIYEILSDDEMFKIKDLIEDNLEDYEVIYKGDSMLEIVVLNTNNNFKFLLDHELITQDEFNKTYTNPDYKIILVN